jgi:hypothetical protein
MQPPVAAPHFLTPPRVVEWHGFHQVTAMLNKEEVRLLTHRLGRHNMFDEAAAVGYYSLDLEKDEDRWWVGVCN